MPQQVHIEVACFNAVSALLAQQGGADRIELCANPLEGGTTPSYGEVEIIKSALNIPVHVIVRPRGGDFLYTPTEMKIMLRDIEMFREMGVDGIVTGALSADGSVNITPCREMAEAAFPMNLTFHRAFDVTKDPFRSLEFIIGCGFHRILTSGGMQTAVQGKGTIRELIKSAAGRIKIMPGGGVNEQNISGLVEFTNAAEYHISARKYVSGKMIYRHDAVQISAAAGTDHIQLLVDAEKVALTRKTAQEVWDRLHA